MVKMKNLLNQNTWLWERGKFMNRRYIMQVCPAAVFLAFLSNQYLPFLLSPSLPPSTPLSIPSSLHSSLSPFLTLHPSPPLSLFPSLPPSPPLSIPSLSLFLPLLLSHFLHPSPSLSLSPPRSRTHSPSLSLPLPPCSPSLLLSCSSFQELYQKWLDGENVSNIKENDDPFWEPTEDVLIGL